MLHFEAKTRFVKLKIWMAPLFSPFLFGLSLIVTTVDSNHLWAFAVVWIKKPSEAWKRFQSNLIIYSVFLDYTFNWHLQQMRVTSVLWFHLSEESLFQYIGDSFCRCEEGGKAPGGSKSKNDSNFKNKICGIVCVDIFSLPRLLPPFSALFSFWETQSILWAAPDRSFKPLLFDNPADF